MEALQPYVDAFTRASDRTRSIYLLVLAFSVICLAAFLNSFQYGWLQSRLQKARLAYAFLYITDKRPQSLESTLTRDQIEAAKTYISLGHIETLDEMKMVLDNVERQALSSSIVQVPLFGLSFHTNDLGFVAGLSLFFLLMLLKYALTREMSNLELAVRKAAALDVTADAYEILSTSEVLHQPVPLPNPSQRFWKRPLFDAPAALLFVPVVAYAVVVANDHRSAAVGRFLSPVFTGFILVFEWIAIFLLSLVAAQCFGIIRKTRGIWTEMQSAAVAGTAPTEASQHEPSQGGQ